MKIFPLVIALFIMVGCTNSESTDQSAEKNKTLNGYLTQAKIFYKKVKLDSAIMYCDSALSVANETSDKLYQAEITRIKGSALLRMDSSQLAVEYLKKARMAASSIQNDTIQAMAELHLGYGYQRLGKMDSVLFMYNHALSIYESNGDTVGMAKVLNNLSIYHKSTGNWDKALESAMQTYHIFKREDDKEKLANSLISLGNVYEKLAEYDTALACFQLAYDIGAQIENNNLTHLANANMGVVHKRKGNLLMAMEILQKSFDYYQKSGNNRQLVLILSNISLVYYDLGDVDKAISSAQEALDLSRKIGYKRGEVWALNNLGLYYKSIEKYDKAKESFRASLELALQLESKDGMEDAYSNLSNVYEITGDYKKALEYRLLHAVVKDSILNENRIRKVSEIKGDYYILQLKDQNVINELENKSLRSERNISFATGIFVIVILIWIAIYFRMKIKKNRIIAAQKIQQLEDEKKLLEAQSVILGQEKERKRIAQELHDGIGVLLSTASIHFSGVEQNTKDNKTNEMIKKAKDLLSKAGGEVRKISQNMMPVVLSKFGLREAIEDLFDELEESGRIRTEVTMICTNDRLTEDTEIMVYRIVQEMINNTLKHAEATEITCRLKRDPELIIIDYSDNGKGFDTDALPRNKSLGIYGIRSRVDFLHGEIELKSTISQGTSYHIRIPVG